MRYTAVIIALAGLALATPTERAAKRACGTPATYRCALDKSTMEVCDWDGAWKPLNPGCPSGTACQDNPYGNNIPYCVAKPVTTTPGGGSPGGACGTAGQYSCFTDSASKPGIQICDVSNKLQTVGMCPNYCAYIAGIPYCF